MESLVVQTGDRYFFVCDAIEAEAVNIFGSGSLGESLGRLLNDGCCCSLEGGSDGWLVLTFIASRAPLSGLMLDCYLHFL